MNSNELKDLLSAVVSQAKQVNILTGDHAQAVYHEAEKPAKHADKDERDVARVLGEEAIVAAAIADAGQRVALGYLPELFDTFVVVFVHRVVRPCQVLQLVGAGGFERLVLFDALDVAPEGFEHVHEQHEHQDHDDAQKQRDGDAQLEQQVLHPRVRCADLVVEQCEQRVRAGLDVVADGRFHVVVFGSEHEVACGFELGFVSEPGHVFVERDVCNLCGQAVDAVGISCKAYCRELFLSELIGCGKCLFKLCYRIFAIGEHRMELVDGASAPIRDIELFDIGVHAACAPGRDKHPRLRREEIGGRLQVVDGFAAFDEIRLVGFNHVSFVGDVSCHRESEEREQDSDDDGHGADDAYAQPPRCARRLFVFRLFDFCLVGLCHGNHSLCPDSLPHCYLHSQSSAL